jgi:TolB protein
MKRSAVGAAAIALLVFGVGLFCSVPAGATAPGTNGRIVYSRFADTIFSHSDIVSANPDGTGVAKLTNTVNGVFDQNPDWAPDGSKVVFQRDSDLSCGQACVQGIYTVNPDGTQLTRLTPNNHEIYWADPAYSPDGTRLSFKCNGCLGSDGGIFVMDADGSNLLQVTKDDSSPYEEDEVQWSPDATRLVFQRNRRSDESTAIFTATIDGTDFRRLTPWRLDAEHPDWSPDGRLIIFQSYGAGAPTGVSTNVFTVRPDGSHLTQVTHDEGGAVNAANAAWSPNGKKIVFVQVPGSGPFGYSDIFTMSADGSDIRQVTTSPALWDYRPDWGTAPTT